MTPEQVQRLAESSAKLVNDYGAMQAAFAFALLAGGAVVVFIGLVFWRMLNTILHGREDATGDGQVAGISTLSTKLESVASTQGELGVKLDEHGRRLSAIEQHGSPVVATLLGELRDVRGEVSKLRADGCSQFVEHRRALAEGSTP